MAVNPNAVPTLSPFQKAHVGTTQTGLSGILPFNKRNASPGLSPVARPTTPAAVIGSHFHIFQWKSGKS